MDSESHTFELSLEIHQVCLSVRFPCSLTFQLKAGIPSSTQIPMSLNHPTPSSSSTVAARPRKPSRLSSASKSSMIPHTEPNRYLHSQSDQTRHPDELQQRQNSSRLTHLRHFLSQNWGLREEGRVNIEVPRQIFPR